jgi:hypothetical protein
MAIFQSVVTGTCVLHYDNTGIHLVEPDLIFAYSEACKQAGFVRLFGK